WACETTTCERAVAALAFTCSARRSACGSVSGADCWARAAGTREDTNDNSARVRAIPPLAPGLLTRFMDSHLPAPGRVPCGRGAGRLPSQVPNGGLPFRGNATAFLHPSRSLEIRSGLAGVSDGTSRRFLRCIESPSEENHSHEA